jgi:Arc/MetJ family transcription regulator
MIMRTNIVLDEQLVNEAMSLSQIKTKRELVEQALKEFVAIRKRLNLLDLAGADDLLEDYDYKNMRSGKNSTQTTN